MSSPEESPAQRAARLRRERREAKIKEGGASRLDKITSLSGRTPSKHNEDASPSPSLQPPTVIPSPSPSPTPEARPAARPAQPTPMHPSSSPQNPDEPTPDMLREQQEALRALLRQPAPSSGPQDDLEEDPALKLFNALIGGMPAAASAASSRQGAESAPSAGGIADLASSLGLPPFFSNMLGAATQPQTDEQKKAILTWKILHIVFALVVGIYLIFLTGASVTTYGSSPPPPATAQNPFLYFTTGELVLSGARIMTKSGNGGLSGPFLWIQIARDVIRDGSVVLFLFGMSAWWNREW